jgi:hypothetical protein
VPHQAVHQALRLIRTEDIDPFFRSGDVIAAAQERAAELRHEGDGRLLAQSCEDGIGIVPECGNVNVDAGSGAQGSALRISWHRISSSRADRHSL